MSTGSTEPVSDAGPPAVIDRVARWLAEAGPRSVTVLTGAGISTDSGIPDFRGPQGVWTRDPAAEALSQIDVYRNDPAVRRRVWQARLTHPAWRARPNAAHRALLTLERTGCLRALITQNIDGLHQAAGHEPARVLEIHGTMHEVECLSCGWRGPTGPTLDRVRAGEPDPACLLCGGVLKTATISFGQSLREELIEASTRAARACSMFLAIGTSLTVYPAATLPVLAVRAGARLVVLNAEPTPCDELADACLDSPIGRVLPLLVAGLADLGAPGGE